MWCRGWLHAVLSYSFSQQCNHQQYTEFFNYAEEIQVKVLRDVGIMQGFNRKMISNNNKAIVGTGVYNSRDITKVGL